MVSTACMGPQGFNSSLGGITGERSFLLLFHINKRLISVFFALLTVTIPACQENDRVGNLAPIPKPEWRFLGLEEHWALELELEGSYLYACVGDEGLYRMEISKADTVWEYVGLQDTSISDTPFGHYVNNGVQDVVKLENGDILAGLISGIPEFPGIYRSSDGGMTWTASDSGLRNGTPYASVFRLGTTPCDGKVVLACTAGAVFRSEDAGRSWEKKAGSYYSGVGTHALEAHPRQCNIVWIGGETSYFEGGLAKSTDAGETWEGIFFDDVVPQDNAVYDIALDPTDTDIVYVGMMHGVIKTTDGGESWISPLFSAGRWASFQALVIDNAAPEHLFAARGADIYETWNGGETVSLLEAPISTWIYDMEHDAERQILYVGTRAGAYAYYTPSCM